MKYKITIIFAINSNNLHNFALPLSKEGTTLKSDKIYITDIC